ncbi:MAG: hypothetical protein ACE5FA_12730, partial [Dehalococcoidia bacterium]
MGLFDHYTPRVSRIISDMTRRRQEEDEEERRRQAEQAARQRLRAAGPPVAAPSIPITAKMAATPSQFTLSSPPPPTVAAPIPLKYGTGFRKPIPITSTDRFGNPLSPLNRGSTFRQLTGEIVG